MLNVTTSWDDGDILDQRLADLLNQYGLRGTFYITRNYRPQRLGKPAIRELALTQEIGAHTLTHSDLRLLTPDQRREEITGGKKWLEETSGSPVKMFCYPRGLYDEAVVAAVKEAGFAGARTVGLSTIALPVDPFRLHTTIQVYPFPLRKLGNKRYYLRKLFEPYAQRSLNLHQLGVSRLVMYSWISTAKAVFDITRQNGQIFHLWGHSWEIEKYQMWDDLENLFQHMQKRADCAYLTNGELLKTIASNRSTTH